MIFVAMTFSVFLSESLSFHEDPWLDGERESARSWCVRNQNGLELAGALGCSCCLFVPLKDHSQGP